QKKGRLPAHSFVPIPLFPNHHPDEPQSCGVPGRNPSLPATIPCRVEVILTASLNGTSSLHGAGEQCSRFLFRKILFNFNKIETKKS
ncbi:MULTISPECIES: hypothetical protein, partial [Pseudomonadaceae]|uniref:hypothetical protein n=1 Tax=Pseudomonadaceae TaxID=135621 RepID=UPI00197D2147